MNIKRKVFFTLIIVLITAIFIQVGRLGVFEKAFVVKQTFNEISKKELKGEKPKKYKKILVLYSQKDEGSKMLYNNINNAFRMTKINYKKVNIDSPKAPEMILRLKKEDILVVGTERIYEFTEPQILRQYIKNGGKAVFLIRTYFPYFDEIFGIKKNRNFSKNNSHGFRFKEKIFPGLDDIEIKSKKITHSYLDINLNKKSKVLATDIQGNPIVWTHKYGKGEILFINSTMMLDKSNRGLMLQYISYIDDYFLMTIFNGKVVNIDDFPAPIKSGKDEIIYNNYHMDNKKFYRHIWWSSMYNLAQKYNIKYTGLMIGTYNDLTKSPLEKLKDEEIEDMKYFGRKLFEAGGELGIHGYNHNSLALKGQMDFKKYGYNKWESQKVMEEGLKILRDKIHEIFGEVQIYTYVPPSNIISIEGKKAVKNVFKNIQVFAGLYTGVAEKGVLYQEFGEDNDVPGVYAFPRFSSGYEYNEEVMWDIYNGIAHYGLINHFIHPDDLLDYERSKGRSWKELYKDLTKIFSETYHHYKFLRPMTNKEAINEYISKENLRIYVSKDDEFINIYYENFIPPAYHYLRLRDKEILSIQGGEFSIVDKDLGLYLIKGRDSKVKIKLK